MNPRALEMIEIALNPLIRSGCRIERVKLVVCPGSQIAGHKIIQTRYGSLRVEPYDMVGLGLAYLIEDPGRKGRGFAWVSRKGN